MYILYASGSVWARLCFLKDEFLTFDEIERLARLFVSIGVRKIRLTGGEPLLRKDLTKLIARLMKIDGLLDIGLTTNAIHLTKQAKVLKEAGLHRVNVSLDAIDDDVFKAINGRNINTCYKGNYGCKRGRA